MKSMRSGARPEAGGAGWRWEGIVLGERLRKRGKELQRESGRGHKGAEEGGEGASNYCLLKGCQIYLSLGLLSSF